MFSVVATAASIGTHHVFVVQSVALIHGAGALQV